MRPRRRPGAPVVAVAALAAVTACLSGNEFDPLAPPETSSTLAPADTTAPPDYSTVPLAAVAGTTTTAEVVVGPGPVTLAGQVHGPDGPVPGATVRVERLVGDGSAHLDVVTGEDGTWTVPGVLGGRYRIRAWRPPDLAGVEPQVLFVDPRGAGSLVLTVERFPAMVVDTAVAPDPPRVGERTSLRVRVVGREVDGDGIVRALPRPQLAVTVQPGPGWAVEPPAGGLTDEAGNVTFVLVCRMPGPQSLTVTVASTEVVPVTTPACEAPPPPATTAPPAITVPTSPTTTSGSSPTTSSVPSPRPPGVRR